MFLCHSKYAMNSRMKYEPYLYKKRKDDGRAISSCLICCRTAESIASSGRSTIPRVSPFSTIKARSSEPINKKEKVIKSRVKNTISFLRCRSGTRSWGSSYRIERCRGRCGIICAGGWQGGTLCSCRLDGFFSDLRRFCGRGTPPLSE